MKLNKTKLLNKIKGIFDFLYVYKKETTSLNIDLISIYSDLFLVTVAFNNSNIIKQQYKYIKDNLLDGSLYVIADNSSEDKESKEIMSFAKENVLVYIKLPPNLYSNINPSKSHGLALNFICKKIIHRGNFKYLGFIDQDIFPTEKLSIIDKINNLPYYGLVQKRGNFSYLWPGFCFFSKEFLLSNIKKINFMPVKGLDTGGGNYKIYDNKLLAKISIKHYYIKADTKEKIYTAYFGIQKDCVEFIGGWVHIMNSSNWLGDPDSKNKKDLFNIIKT